MMAGSGLFIALWYSLSHWNNILTAKPTSTRIDAGKLSNGIYFYDDFILTIKGNHIRFFSSKCTHAGCRINREIAGEIVCSCHGSKFDSATGKVLRGPALNPLRALPHRTDLKTGELIVKV